MGKLLRIFGFPASRDQCVIVLAREFVCVGIDEPPFIRRSGKKQGIRWTRRL